MYNFFLGTVHCEIQITTVQKRIFLIFCQQAYHFLAIFQRTQGNMPIMSLESMYEVPDNVT